MVDYAQARRTMVDSQVRPSDVTDLRLIAALLDVPRERFVPATKRNVAYLDLDLPLNAIGSRALLKPMVFGKLLQAAAIGDGERVLDVGSATGYSSAVLAKLAGSVVALEEDSALTKEAGAATGVEMASGPLAKGWAQGAPYDVILLEGACEEVPEALFAQLKDGGRLLAVVGAGPMGKATMYSKAGEHVSAVPLFDAAAPMLPGFAKAPAFVF